MTDRLIKKSAVIKKKTKFLYIKVVQQKEKRKRKPRDDKYKPKLKWEEKKRENECKNDVRLGKPRTSQRKWITTKEKEKAREEKRKEKAPETNKTNGSHKNTYV